MNYEEKALKYFNAGYNCSQSVFTAFAEVAGIDEETAKKISAGFGGGFGRRQSACGALTGAILVIGAKYHDEKDVLASKEIVYKKTLDFINNFEKLNGGIECLEILGTVLGSEDFKSNKDLYHNKCEGFVANACRLIEKVLL